MCTRIEMLQAALDLMEEGVVLLDEQAKVVFWNKPAAALTGYSPEEFMAERCPENLYRIDESRRTAAPGARQQDGFTPLADGFSWADAAYVNRPLTPLPRPVEEIAVNETVGEPIFVSMHHKLGHAVPSILRKAILFDCNSARAGTALLFHPIEEMDKLPHGESGDDSSIERCQADMEDRLDAAHHQWVTSRVPFGLLWVIVDQAQDLRVTHGREACEAMLRTVEQTLVRQLKPAEIIGRWGCSEFLVLVHERTPELLLERARRFAGLARTADFRWWGDRVALTISIGASQAVEDDTLQSLLHRTRNAMQASQYAGGNHVTEAKGNACSQS